MTVRIDADTPGGGGVGRETTDRRDLTFGVAVTPIRARSETGEIGPPGRPGPLDRNEGTWVTSYGSMLDGLRGGEPRTHQHGAAARGPQHGLQHDDGHSVDFFRAIRVTALEAFTRRAARRV